MELVCLEFKLQTTGKNLRACIKFDGQEIFNDLVGLKPVPIKHQFDDDTETDHVLEITMMDKSPEDTVLDEHGKIIDDQLMSVTKIYLADIDIAYIFYDQSEYTHAFNTDQPVSVHKFWGDMGCNGTVKFTFSSPSYLWLLENM